MDEFIKRKDLLEIMDDIAKDETCPMNIAADIYQAVDCIPAEDVEPVRHGHWEEYSVSMMVCSLCGKHTAKHNFKYCPNCGARMDGSEEYQ